ncbi:MAG: mechanosensitive ion channel [Planctomycetales bacterium]|nr:mechanosensitive ion channel [Planctomycetales bacterium]
MANNEAPISESPPVLKTTVTKELVEAEIASVEKLTDLSEETKKESLDRLRKALDWIKSNSEYSAARTNHEQAIASVPNRRKELQAELAQTVSADPVMLPPDATVAQLESKLAEMRHAVESLEAETKAREAELQNRTVRLGELGKDIVETEKRIVDAKQQIGLLTDADAITRFKQIEQQSRLQARQEQLLSLKAEQQRLEACADVLPLERDFARRKLTVSQKQLESWQSTVDTWRKDESARQAKQARIIAQNSHPALQALAEENAEIADVRSQIATKIEKSTGMLKEIKSVSQRLGNEFEELRKKVDLGGTTSSTGVLLRTHRDQLPDEDGFKRRAKYVQDELPATSLKLIEFRSKRVEIVDPQAYAEQLAESIENVPANVESSLFLDALIRLISDRKDLLDSAIADQTTYLQDLNELELANSAFGEQIDEMQNYLDQRVLWVKSAEPFGLADVSTAWQEAKYLFAAKRWAEVLKVAFGDVFLKPASAVAIISLFLLLMMGRVHLLRTQRALCTDQQGKSPVFARYAAAFGLSIVMSARWPVLIWALAYRLTVAGTATDWTRAVGSACMTTALMLWACELMRELCRRGGLAEELFEWPSSATATVRATLDFTLIVAAPLLALVQLSGHSEISQMQDLQRLLFVGSLALLSFQSYVLTRPNGPLMLALKSDKLDQSSLFALRKPICALLTVLPLAFCILSLSGYHFSAVQLTARLAETGGAIIGIILLYNLATCWLDARARASTVELSPGTPAESREQTDEHVEEMDEEAEAIPAAIPTIKNAHRDAQDLVRYAALLTLALAAWVIWDEVLPALRVLDQFELWSGVETVAESVVDQDGIQSIRTNEKTVITTLTDLLKAIVVCFAFVIFGRRLPSVLDLMVLNRISMDQGGRQAVTILMRYGITLAGVVIGCGIVNISWSSVQWLAAAMTVGLGFGLQEIFANLVSGLIILFERPIRAGDLVTVGDLTGNVTRMQIRATTITDFDRREMIVPNKKFITDNVINWTLSDPISRVVFSVGVAYGTDVRRVQRILMRIAKRSPLVLAEPAPTTLFKGFGSSTLDVDLRVFIPKRDVYVDVVNELNLSIAQEFSNAGIEIAFPQQDIHIKSIDGLAASITDLLEPAAKERRAS